MVVDSLVQGNGSNPGRSKRSRGNVGEYFDTVVYGWDFVYSYPTPGGTGGTMEAKGSLAKEPGVKKVVLQRLRTAIGHLSAVERMVEEERYCVDILKQLSAVQASLSKIAYAISDAHMRHCVREAIAEGKGEEKVEEMLEILKYLRHF